MAVTNLSQYYGSKGQRLPSLSSRSSIYAKYGLGSAGSYRGTASQNTALLRKLQSGSTSKPKAPARVAPKKSGSTLDPYEKMIKDYYKMKPADPGYFKYSAEQEAADKRSVGQETQPFYQEQISESTKNFAQTMKNAREGFSRRGLWGAAGAATPELQLGGFEADRGTPVLALPRREGYVAPEGTPAEAPRGPVSGLRQVGERMIGEERGIAETAFSRAYDLAVASGTQGRRAEQETTHQKQIRTPYEDAMKVWNDQLTVLQSQQKYR